MAERALLPAWAETVRRKYLSGEASVFLLHLNVYDTFYYEGRAYSLAELIGRVLLWDNKKSILCFDPAAGVSVVKERGAGAARKSFPNRSPRDVLPVLEDVLFNSDATGLLVTYAATLAPAGTTSFLSEQDRVNVVTFHRWSLSEQLTAKDNVVFLITESLAEIHPSLVSNPRIAAVAVPMPDLDERAAVVRRSDPSLDAEAVMRLAQHSAGLKAVQIANLLTPQPEAGLDDEARRVLIATCLGESKDAAARAEKLAAITRGMSRDEIRHLIAPEAPAHDAPAYPEVLELVARRKREIIEKECYGLIEFVEGEHDFAVVGGNEGIKQELLEIARSIKEGDRRRIPMGLLFVGPMGSGKTFVAGCFARAAGLAAVKLKNIRSKWVGSTEANLEKVLSMVQALGPIILIIDEGDRALAGGGEGDGGTTSRVLARLKEFLSDTSNRGRVLSIVMTNRPDKLDLDIKRAGRLDRKIPFFYPYTADEVEGVLGAILRRYAMSGALAWPQDRAAISAKLIGYSHADLEAVALLANDIAARAGVAANAESFASAIADYMPPRDVAMIELMELLAVFETSRRGMLPEKYRALTNDELGNRLSELRRQTRS